MLMGMIWTGMIISAVLFSCANGTTALVAEAALEGAAQAVHFCIEVGGIMCLWCAVMELMRECGLADGLAKLLKPLLGGLFPKFKNSSDVMEPLAANVSANLLGLGNAATPMGIKAATAMSRHGKTGVASDELCRLVVLNTASIQLLPTTVAAVRSAAGAASPFDILPAVWISSAISVAVGLTAAKVLAVFWK